MSEIEKNNTHLFMN